MRAYIVLPPRLPCCHGAWSTTSIPPPYVPAYDTFYFPCCIQAIHVHVTSSHMHTRSSLYRVENKQSKKHVHHSSTEAGAPSTEASTPSGGKSPTPPRLAHPPELRCSLRPQFC